MKSRPYFVQDIPRRRFLQLGLGSGLLLATRPWLVDQALSQPNALKTELDPGLYNRVMQKALSTGGDFAELYVEHRISREIEMKESRFNSGVLGISQGAGVRVLSKNKTGYAYTDSLQEKDLLRAAEIAAAIAKGKTKIPVAEPRSTLYPQNISVKFPLEAIADPRRLDVMERANQAALDYDPRIKMVIIDYYDEIRGRTIVNSEGLMITDELPLIFFIVQTLGESDGNRHMSRERISEHSGFEMFDRISPEKVARTAARESIDMLSARDCPAGKMDIVMQNGWGGVLVHEAVGHPLEADNIAKEVGAFTGKLGQKVASDVFTMIDDGTLPNFRGTTNVDDEGTPMQRNVLIKDGVLLKYMSDRLSAQQIEQERTGNARRASFKHLPIPRMTNTFIDKGTDDPADILADTKKGLYVQSLSGGSVNPTTGMFNFTCREAYLIENGVKTTPVKGATLVGGCMDIVSNIDAVGHDLDFAPGICGKDGQWAEVTAGQPTVRIRGMNVGGSKS